MIYTQLITIIRSIKKNVSCPQCRRHFLNEHIDIIDIYENESFIVTYCPRCDLAVEISVSVEDQETMYSKNFISNYTHSLRVTEDDIKGIAKRLKKHKGSIKDLLN